MYLIYSPPTHTPFSPHPLVTASNCVPLKPHLQRIFFKEDHLKPTQESSGSSTGAAATEGGEGKKNEFHVAEQVSGIRQQFVFPDPLVRPSSDTPPSTSLMLTFTVGSHHKDKDIQQALSASTASPGSHAALILDVPLGMRLLNSYRLGYKDKIMRMWKKGGHGCGYLPPTSSFPPLRLPYA